MIGLYLQVKKIKRVKQEKAFTWEIEIYQSIVCIFFFGFSVCIEIFEQLIPQDGESTQLALCMTINLLVQVYCYSTLQRIWFLEEKYQNASTFNNHRVSNYMDRPRDDQYM